MNVAVTRSGGVSAVVEYDYTAKEPDEINLVKGAIIHNVKQMPGGWWEGTLQSNGKSGMFPDNFVRVVDANNDNTVTMRDKSATTNHRCKVIFSYTQVNDDELSLAVGDVIEFLGEVEEGWWRGRLKNKIGVFPSNFVTTIEPSPILASKRPPSQSASTGVPTSPPSSIKTKPTAAVTSAAATSSSTSISTKKMNRLSFHSSKEDLLTSTITAATTTASAPAVDNIAPILPPKPAREYCRVEFPYAPQNDDELELKIGDVITIINVELPDKGWWKGELRGKVGVFPDNFVKLLTEVSPLNETQHASLRTAKSSNAGNSSTATSSTTNNIALATATTSSASSSATTSKVFIKKSGSTSSTQSSNRKDSFGSRDSLNDILSETGLPSGNVAAQRKSLENKNLDLSNAPDATTRLGLRKQQTQQHSNNTITTTTTTSALSSTVGGSELRKSLENMDEKVKTPPPVLTKKPTVPSKKSTTVTSVAGNILSGLKQKVKNVENKLTTTVSHDYADGVGSSKASSGGLPDSGASGNAVMRRAATIAVEDSDFDRVERLSILTDMRAGRVKAPKRRPPSAAINVIGESNNNDLIYLNGSNDSGSGGDLQQSDGEMGGKPHSSDDNSISEGEQLAKPKPREWGKVKAPWMEELKASQVKKKTSPNVEPRTITSSGVSSVTERTSKPIGDDAKITSSNSSNNASAATSSASSSSTTTTTTSNSTSSATKVQSSTISSSIIQQSVTVESSSSNQSVLKSKELTIATAATDVVMSKNRNSKLVNDALTSSTSSTIEEVRTRPNSLSIRNRSISPGATLKTSASPATTNLTETTAPASSSNSASLSASAVSSTTAKTTLLNNNHHNSNSSTNTTTKLENNIPAVGKTTSSASASGDSLRVHELERRVGKLEAVVHAQQRTIDELVRTLREETDRVKLLRGELDKYAQCVTQV